MSRDFDNIIENLKTTIASYDYFVDFNKVYRNVDLIYESLELLNTLIGSTNFENDFLDLIHSHKEVLKALPILIAVRDKTITLLDTKTIVFIFDDINNTDEEYLRFVKETGIQKLLTSGRIHNLIDYVIGVEVGLDSNARKNRTGKLMEDLVSNYLNKETNGKYLCQATKKEIKETYGYDEIENLNLVEGKNQADKRFDFAFKVDEIVYLVETNFYGSGGSKLNEVARSYEKLADEINKSIHFRFIWITDGKGWLTTKNGLKESYTHQEYLFTIKDLEDKSVLDLIGNYLK